jgi:hypothetical protein
MELGCAWRHGKQAGEQKSTRPGEAATNAEDAPGAELRSRRGRRGVVRDGERDRGRESAGGPSVKQPSSPAAQQLRQARQAMVAPSNHMRWRDKRSHEAGRQH